MIPSNVLTEINRLGTHTHTLHCSHTRQSTCRCIPGHWLNGTSLHSALWVSTCPSPTGQVLVIWGGGWGWGCIMICILSKTCPWRKVSSKVGKIFLTRLSAYEKKKYSTVNIFSACRCCCYELASIKMISKALNHVCCYYYQLTVKSDCPPDSFFALFVSGMVVAVVHKEIIFLICIRPSSKFKTRFVFLF